MLQCGFAIRQNSFPEGILVSDDLIGPEHQPDVLFVAQLKHSEGNGSKSAFPDGLEDDLRFIY